MRFVKWEDDRLDSKQGSVLVYDKLEHFMLAFAGVLLFYYLTPYFFANPSPPIDVFSSNLFVQVMLVRIIGIFNEVKDALVPYDKEKGLIQGFSIVDLLANEIGLVTAVYFILFLKGELWNVLAF